MIQQKQVTEEVKSKVFQALQAGRVFSLLVNKIKNINRLTSRINNRNRWTGKASTALPIVAD